MRARVGSEAGRRELLELVVAVEGLDGAHRARLGAHHHRLGRRAEVGEAHALQEVAVGDGRRREVAVVALDEVVGREDSVNVVALGLGEGPLGLAAGVQDALDLSAEALERGGGDDALGSPADAEDGPDVTARRVRDLMTADVVTCEPATTVTTLMTIMTERRIRHVPVVEDGHLVGLVSIGDVVKARVDELERERRELLDYVSGR